MTNYGDHPHTSHQGIVRDADFVLAAADSPPIWQQQADLVCDGVADEVEINYLMTLLSANRGTLALAPGNYTLAAQFVAQSNADLVGYGMPILTIASTSLDKGFLFNGNTNITVTGVHFKRTSANTAFYQAVNFEGACDETVIFNNCIFEVRGTGNSITALFTDDTSTPVFNNCRGISDGVAFLAQGSSAPHLVGCRMYGGTLSNNAYGGYTADIATPICVSSYFFGGGQGVSTTSNHGFAVTDSSKPNLTGCVCEGGEGTTSAGLYVSQAGIAEVVGSTLRGGSGSGGDAVNVLRAARVNLSNTKLVPGGRGQNSRAIKMDDNVAQLMCQNVSAYPYQIGGYERDNTATFTFEFSADHPVTNIHLHLLVQTAGGASATLDIGTTPGGTDIVNGADISATGNVYPTLGATGAYRDIIAAGTTIYVTITPDGGSPDVDIYWNAWTGYTNCASVILDGDGKIEIVNSSFRSTGLSGSPALQINTAARVADNMFIANCVFDRNAQADAAYNPAPLYNCTITNAALNITAAAGTANGSNIVV